MKTTNDDLIIKYARKRLRPHFIGAKNYNKKLKSYPTITDMDGIKWTIYPYDKYNCTKKMGMVLATEAGTIGVCRISKGNFPKNKIIKESLKIANLFKEGKLIYRLPNGLFYFRKNLTIGFNDDSLNIQVYPLSIDYVDTFYEVFERSLKRWQRTEDNIPYKIGKLPTTINESFFLATREMEAFQNKRLFLKKHHKPHNNLTLTIEPLENATVFSDVGNALLEIKKYNNASLIKCQFQAIPSSTVVKYYLMNLSGEYCIWKNGIVTSTKNIQEATSFTEEDCKNVLLDILKSNNLQYWRIVHTLG